jgi:hypothetical protein
MRMRLIPIHLITTAGIASASPSADRQAIPAMAGTHAVTFRFYETVAVSP